MEEDTPKAGTIRVNNCNRHNLRQDSRSPIIKYC